jgi:hypothetical protein
MPSRPSRREGLRSPPCHLRESPAPSSPPPTPSGLLAPPHQQRKGYHRPSRRLLWGQRSNTLARAPPSASRLLAIVAATCSSVLAAFDRGTTLAGAMPREVSRMVVVSGVVMMVTVRWGRRRGVHRDRQRGRGRPGSEQHPRADVEAHDLTEVAAQPQRGAVGIKADRAKRRHLVWARMSAEPRSRGCSRVAPAGRPP